ncbi:hypothetical protein [Pantoea sp. App145]|uniref:hypothetical protein n=1 Tax=Pantoea sp. App145 TaxID=3071567 RepID=UPI003A807323
MVNNVNSNHALSFAPAFDIPSSSAPQSALPYPPCEKSILSTLNSSISHASESNFDWTDNHFISETFDAICTPEVTDWLQAETGLDYRPPVHQEDDGPVPLRSRFYGQAETLTPAEREKLVGALQKLEKNCRMPEEKPEEAVLPEMENWKAGLEKLKEFRRLGKNREHLTVDIPRLQEKAVDLAEREWMPDTRHAGASLQLLCQEVSSHKLDTGDQKVAMFNAVHTLCKLAEALEKADTLLAGVAEYRQSGDPLALSVRPEEIRRDLQRAREETHFASLWNGVAKTTDKASWQDQESLHTRLLQTFEALESGCRRAEQAIEDTRPVYLKEMRAEQAWLREEAGAMMEACQSSSHPLIRQTAEALDQLCHLTANAMSEPGGYKDWVITALRKSAGDLCDLSAALRNAAAIRPLVLEEVTGGKEVRALTEKALNTVMNELKNVQEKLEKHQKRLGNVPFSGMNKSEIPAALNTLKNRVSALAKLMDTERQAMKAPLPENPADFMLRALDHSRAARWMGEKDDTTTDVLSALGHMAGKGARGVQNGFAHYRRGAKRSEFNVLMRGAARGPLGMMLRVCRATEKLAFAALEASEKKPDVVRLHTDRNRKIKQDKPAQKVETYRKEKMDALKEAQKTAEGEIEKLALVHGRLNSDLDQMSLAFSSRKKNKNISRMRARCSQSMEDCQRAARQIRAAMDDLVNPGEKAGSAVPATALQDKAAYERARRVITDGLAVMRKAMGKFEVEVALITDKCFDLFSNDARIVRSCAEIVDMCGAGMLPENPTAEDYAESDRVMRRMATEMGRQLPKPQDPEGSDFAERVLQEVRFRREDTAVQAQTPEDVMKFVRSWEQKLVSKASGKMVAGIISRAGRMLARQALPELFGGAIHIAKFAKAVYKASIILSTYYETRKNLENTLKPGDHLLAADKDTVRDTMIKSMTEMIFDTLVPSASDIKLVANTVITGVANRRDGISKVADQVLKDAKEEGAITLLLEGFMTGATRVVEEGVKLLSAALEDTPASPAAPAEMKMTGVQDTKVRAVQGSSRVQGAARLTQDEPTEETKQPVKSRRKREASPDIEQAPADVVQPPVNAAPEAADEDSRVSASQRTSVGRTGPAKFSMTDKEYNDTLIGIEARQSTSTKEFIERDIQKIIDKYPDAHGKITSPYSWVKIQVPHGLGNKVSKVRVIDIYIGNVHPKAHVLWEGSDGGRDATGTSQAFREELFGQMESHIDPSRPKHIIPRYTATNDPSLKPRPHSARLLREKWDDNMKTQRKNKPKIAAQYKNLFKFGFSNAQTSADPALSPEAQDAVNRFLGGDNRHVITLSYNGQPVPDMIAIEVNAAGDNSNERKLLIMDYEGNLKQVTVKRAGVIFDGENRHIFEPDAEMQAFISKNQPQADKETVKAKPGKHVAMMYSGNDFGDKLAETHLNSQEKEFKRVVPDPGIASLNDLIDDSFEMLSVGLAPIAKTTLQGVFISGGLTLVKGFLKYHLNRDDPEAQKNISVDTGRELASNAFTNAVGGGLINRATKFSQNAQNILVVPNSVGITTKKLADGATEIVAEASRRLGYTTTERSGAELHKESSDAENRDKWQRALDDIDNGFNHVGNHSLSAETITFLREQGIDIDRLIKLHSAGNSFANATTEGVTDYSQVKYDYQGVNDIYGKANAKYKQWEQSQRLERIDNQLKKLQESLSGSETVTIPFSLLQDLREAGVRIDEFLQGNAPYRYNVPNMKYEVPSEASELDQTQAKRLRFIVKVHSLDEKDIEGGVKILREIRDSMAEGERVYIPEKLISMLKMPGSNAQLYVRDHGNVGPALMAASRKGFASPMTNLNMGDYTMGRKEVDKLIDMFWGQSVTGQRAAYNDLITHINDIEVAEKPAGISPADADADVKRHSLPTKFIEAVRKDERFDIDGYLARNAQYSPTDGRMLLSQNQLNQLAAELYATLGAKDRNEIDLLSTSERIESNHKASAANWKSAQEDLEGIMNGSKRPLSKKTINFLKANGINIENLLVGNGTLDSVIAAKDEANDNINSELIVLDKKGATVIRKKIDHPLRVSKIPEKLEQLEALKATLGDEETVNLPESLRVFLKDSSLIDDNDPYIKNLKTTPVSEAELEWMIWALKAEEELSETHDHEAASPSKTAAFMSKLEDSTFEEVQIMLSPHLIERLRAHGVDIDNYLQKNGDPDIAKEMAEQRGEPGNLRSQDILVSKSQIEELRLQLLALQQAPTVVESPTPPAENTADTQVTT